jgi:hypothetical protein
MRNVFASALMVLFAAIALSGAAIAQGNPESGTKDQTGFTSYVEFDGTTNSVGQEYILDSNVGYIFTKHFSMDVGVPFYFITTASSDTTGSTSASGIGNPLAGLRWRFPNDRLNFGTALTLSAPLGDKSLGVNTGHATFDWTNHFDHSFNRVTPFMEAGFSNTTADSRLFIRPYTSYGYNTHLRGGANVDVWRFISVGAAGYDIAPFGTQTITPRGHNSAANAGGGGSSGIGVGSAGLGGGHNSVPTQTTTGTASIAKDYGYSAWLDASLNRYVDAEVGYTRSAPFDLNTVSFSLGFNVGRLAHKSR